MYYEWVMKSIHGGKVDRAHTIPIIQRYNVAEHSFNAMVLSRCICEELDRPFAGVLNYLLFHDVAEVHTGDIPAPIKKVLPGIYEIEQDWMDEHSPQFSTAVFPEEKELASLCDTLELLLFCLEESRLGNRHPLFVDMMLKAYHYARDKMINMQRCETALEIMSECRRTIKEISI